MPLRRNDSATTTKSHCFTQGFTMNADAIQRMHLRGEKAAQDFYFHVNAEAASWPQLTVLEVASVLATERDPLKRKEQLERLACSTFPAAPIQAPPPPQPAIAAPVKDRLGQRDDALHRVKGGRVERPHTRT
ncbi:Microtubule-associated protein tau [Frankliniella fusca]|uniref:Microtubule-associated protein tau n=1 Tax=Frankliniella fusca TaxID=407009 RepID=A0AAE1LNQ3_9NEOP|nr:Microtubule-associated protein tau [Frankliniella fusca]